jgi:thiosulfate/3-mercaptopyruvate sulfurtransferase
MPWLINAAQLDKFRKNQKNVIILDATAHQNGRDAKQEFIDKHIIDAQFFDINEFTDPNADLRNTLLTDEKLISEKLGKLGIRNDYKIILYDNSDLHTACRALWMLKMFGHNPQQLYILDGGFKSWENTGGKTESGPVSFSPKTYTARLDPQYVRTLSDMKSNLSNSTAQIIDLRHPVRYAGGKESRPGLRGGHIPGSFCLPFYTLFEKNGTFLSLDKLRKKFIELGVDIQAPIVTSCGSGTTAPILNFYLDLLSHPNHALYAGSWSEWGAEKLYPGETSLDERPVATCLEK